jgi:hypothetical protein
MIGASVIADPRLEVSIPGQDPVEVADRWRDSRALASF